MRIAIFSGLRIGIFAKVSMRGTKLVTTSFEIAGRVHPHRASSKLRSDVFRGSQVCRTSEGGGRCPP